MKPTLLVAYFAAAAFAQPGPDLTLDAATRAKVIDAAVAALNTAYVFPETAKKMEQSVRDKLRNHGYDSVTSSREFAQTLTTDLQSVSHDKHLRVNFISETLPPEQPPSDPDPREIERQRMQSARVNFGFEKVERLAGNIGYLDLRAFQPINFMAETAVSAMNFLTNTEGLIIDLRQNGGGDPASVALMCTYLFAPGQEVHLNDLYWRPRDETHQWWTLPYVPGKRYAGKDVYVLTSNRTFSAAEEFTYNLKNLKRATIVGETTGGGAHPGGGRRLNDHFVMFVPSGRAINPISKTNWEGTGVEPDVKVAAAKALKTAHLMALEKQLPTLTAPGLKSAVGNEIEKLKKELAEQ
jgi:hypothetical protein